MNDDYLIKMFTGQTALSTALMMLLINKNIVSSKDVIESIDKAINYAGDQADVEVASLRHARHVILQLYGAM